jgi:hypothetical protein
VEVSVFDPYLEATALEVSQHAVAVVVQDPRQTAGSGLDLASADR